MAMSTLAKAILTNGRGEFFLDEVKLGDPEPGEAASKSLFR
jgi:hypothetical protein